MRLGDVVLGWTAAGDGAVGAIPCTNIAQNHECRGPMLPAFADVGTARFLAYRMEIELAHQVLEPHVVGASRRVHLEPRRFPLGERLGAVTPHDLIKSVWHPLRLTGRRGSVELTECTSKAVGAKL